MSQFLVGYSHKSHLMVGFFNQREGCSPVSASSTLSAKTLARSKPVLLVLGSIP